MRVKKKNIATTTLNIQSVFCLPSTTTFTLKSSLLKKKKITEQLIYFHFFELFCLNPFLLRYAHLRTAPTCMHTKTKTCVDWHKHETDLHLCLSCFFSGRRDSGRTSHDPIQQYGGAIRWVPQRVKHLFCFFFSIYLFGATHAHKIK